MGAERTLVSRTHQQHDESGIALIVVLGVISLFSVLVTMQITSSKVSAISSKVQVDRSRVKFASESATAYAQWMIVNYNFNNPTQELVSEDETEEIWKDGKTHTLELVDGVTAVIIISNAISSAYDISQLIRLKQAIISRKASENEEMQEILEEFFAVFSDYTDPDDLRRHPDFGLEKDDYESFGLENFPRNGNMQFREEIYWIKNVEDFLNSYEPDESDVALPEDHVQVIPPQGIQMPGNSSSQPKLSLSSVSDSFLKNNIRNGLSREELQIIQECKQEESSEDLTIEQCLGPDLSTKLHQIVDFNEGNANVFTIDVTSLSPNKEVTRRLVSTINLRNLPSQVGRSDAVSVNPLAYWQRIIY